MTSTEPVNNWEEDYDIFDPEFVKDVAEHFFA